MNSMKSAVEVDALIVELKAKVNAGEITLSGAVFETARACEGWPYTFGAEGRLATKDGVKVRTFDCQGFTEWCLGQFGINIKAAGCTSQWDNNALWIAKGDMSNIPNDTLVCLFHRSKDEPKKMAHTGFGYKGATCECQVGVQYFPQRKSKWQYWAIPKGITDKVPDPDPDYRPILRKGDKGEYVTLAQTELIQRGYDLGSYGADGKFGAKTEAAVKAFQRDWGLAVDGVIGPKTWTMLDSTPAKVLYTVTVPHMSLKDAEALTALYPGAYMKKEAED